eukprot:scaffold4357_cov113-Isochrysis_galbana.AAC.26
MGSSASPPTMSLYTSPDKSPGTYPDTSLVAPVAPAYSARPTPAPLTASSSSDVSRDKSTTIGSGLPGGTRPGAALDTEPATAGMPPARAAHGSEAAAQPTERPWRPTTAPNFARGAAAPVDVPKAPWDASTPPDASSDASMPPDTSAGSRDACKGLAGQPTDRLLWWLRRPAAT